MISPFLWLLNLSFQDLFLYYKLILGSINLNIHGPSPYVPNYTSAPAVIQVQITIVSHDTPSSLWLIHSEIMLILPTKSGFSLYSLIFFFVLTAKTQLWTLFNFRLDYFHNLLISFLAFGFSKAVSQLLGLSNQLILDHVTLILTSIQKVLAACRVKLQFYSPKIWTQFTSFIFLTLKCAQLHLTAIPHPTHINASSSLLIMDLSLVLKQKYFESSYCLPYLVFISPGFQVIQT